jgi:hypothetical protein
MEFGAITNIVLEGTDAAASVSANLSHTRLACCSSIGTLSTYAKEGADWRRLTTWKLPDGTALKVTSTFDWAQIVYSDDYTLLVLIGGVSLL